MAVRYPDYRHLACDDVQFGTWVPIFQEYLLPIFKADMSFTLKIKHQTASK